MSCVGGDYREKRTNKKRGLTRASPLTVTEWILRVNPFPVNPLPIGAHRIQGLRPQTLVWRLLKLNPLQLPEPERWNLDPNPQPSAESADPADRPAFRVVPPTPEPNDPMLKWGPGPRPGA